MRDHEDFCRPADERMEHCKEVIRELCTHVEKLTPLIRQTEPDRAVISHAAGRIGGITGRELR